MSWFEPQRALSGASGKSFIKFAAIQETAELASQVKRKGGWYIAHKFSGQKVSEILRQKKGGIKQAPLPEGSPSWEEFSEMTWEQIEDGAAEDKPGFKLVRKLLSDKRFDK